MGALEVRQTLAYARWFARLRDRQARARVDARIRRLSLGNPGDKQSQDRDIRLARELARNL